MVTFARSPTRSSLKITNRSFRDAAPCLCNELPTDLRESHQIQSASLSPITHMAVHHLHHLHYHYLHLLLLVQSFILNLRMISRTLGPYNVFILLNGWICLHGVLD